MITEFNDAYPANRVSFDLHWIFLDKSGRGGNLCRVASSFPIYLGKIEATLLAGY